MALWQVEYTRDGESMEMIYEGGHDLPDLETVHESLVDNCQIPNNGYKNLAEILEKHSVKVIHVREYLEP
ncbi:hypothetical protein LOY41_12165 [Pseudomonas atacamensis]|uniref:hypothetical protein n=1 Tax=Pseudomonas atacamensis TaxID=2565368 RepID=UPI002160EA62|nr:hypothetical protein [Pseudomonas atacamensis]UVM02004.1 hypothetical protein LOY41_12165 [Pseudomonas atacamensis]